MRTLLVSDSPQDPVCRKLKDALGSLDGKQSLAVTSFHDAERLSLQVQARLVLLVLPTCSEDALAWISRLRSAVPGKLVAVGDASESRFILRALRNGADHYFDRGEPEVEIKAELSRLLNRPTTNQRLSRLIGVLSASGGCGASTIAVNIAAALAKQHEDCVLIDLHQCGDLAALLDLKPQFTLADLCSNEARLDAEMFDKILVRHACGIRLLGAPALFSNARVVSAAGVIHALSLAQRCCSQVVVDLEDCFHEEQVITLHQSTSVLLIGRLDFTSLRNARHILDHLRKLDIPRGRVRLVINQHGKPNELPVTEAEAALGEKLALFIADDPKVIYRANNAGVPAVIMDPSSKVAHSLAQLARSDIASATSA